MGDIEDTFTKQEIQAGYVTSGRDVLARQQQIVQQALSAANGAAGSTPRRRTGCGGPSGTGKASSNPVFPPPSFDEPARASTANLVPAPVSVASQPRSASVATGSSSAFPTISAAAAAAAGSQPVAIPLSRSASTGAVPSSTANTSGTDTTKVAAASSASRKSVAGPPSSASTSAPLAPSGATAASVVAGVHSVNGSSDPSPAHTTLTPLTPLKRAGAKGNSKSTGTTGPSAVEAPKLPNVRTSVSKNKPNGVKAAIQPASSNSSDAGSASSINGLPARVEGVSSIGGDVIAAPLVVAPPIGKSAIPINGMSHVVPTGGPSALGGLDGLGGLGGEVFDGPLQSSSSNSRSAIGAGKDKWNSHPDPGYPVNQSGMWGSSGGSYGGHSPQNLGASSSNDAIGGGIIGGGTIGGGMHGSGSSALASMLGINLPTGSGSLRESTNLWAGSAAVPQQAPISALNGNSMPAQGVIGGSSNPNNTNGLIGGVAIGGNNRQSDVFGNGGNNSDIALLQSLLPGVHITSGSTGGFGNVGGNASNNEWNSAPGPQIRGYGNNPGLAPGNPQQGFNLQSSFGGQPIGQSHQKQRQAPGSTIW